MGSSRGQGTIFDPATLKSDIASLEEEMRAPDFWDDQSHAQSVSTRYSRLRSRLEHYEHLAAEMGDLEAVLEMAAEEGDGDDGAGGTRRRGRASGW